MSTPAMIYLALNILVLGFALAKDGAPRTPLSFGQTVLSTALACGLLYWGGFFDRVPA